MEKGGYPVYRCRRCGEVFQVNTHFQKIQGTAIDLVLSDLHRCGETSRGLCDLIGFNEDEEPKEGGDC